MTTHCCTQVSKAEYVSKGSDALCAHLKTQLEASGLNPYVIPVGGSNALGTWGYMMALEEIEEQAIAMGIEFNDVAMVRCPLKQPPMQPGRTGLTVLEILYQLIIRVHADAA